MGIRDGIRVGTHQLEGTYPWGRPGEAVRQVRWYGYKVLALDRWGVWGSISPPWWEAGIRIGCLVKFAIGVWQAY